MMILAYFAGLATIPVLVAIWAAFSHIRHLFTSTNYGTGCNICSKRWGNGGDGGTIAATRWRAWKHMAFSHPGDQGRAVMTMWRGYGPREHRFRARLFRAFPSHRVTVLDVLARLPFVGEVPFIIANRFGSPQRSM